MVIRTLFPDFLVGDAIPQTEDLPTRETGRSGSRASGTWRICAHGFDLTSYYYVEACQTLRIAIAKNLFARFQPARSGIDQAAAGRALGHSGTARCKVSAEHCAVRGCQLDEGASNFAHFVIAVLRPA